MTAPQPPLTDAAFKGAVLKNLSRISDALEALARASAPEAPNYQRPMSEYATFDWDSIGAQVIDLDEYGPGHVEWGDFVWTRRSPQNKFGDAIWYSRANGKDADGNNKYVRLISFKKASEAEPLPSKVQKTVEAETARAAQVIEGNKPKPGLAAATPESQTEQTGGSAEQAQAKTAKPEAKEVTITPADLAALSVAAYPSDCVPLLDGKEPRYRLVLVWKTGQQFRLPKETLTALCDKYRQQTPPDWAAALKEMDKKI